MKNFKLFTLFLALIAFSPITNAHNPAGTEISYKCLDAFGNYKVTIYYYKRCGGIPRCVGNCSSISSCSIGSLSVIGKDPGYNGIVYSLTVPYGTSVKEVQLNPHCSAYKSVCDDMGCVAPGTYQGFERYKFEAVVNIGSSSSIPAGCCRVAFVFQECCFTYMDNFPGNNTYTEAIVDRCNSIYPNSNSPIPMDDQVIRACTNTGVNMNFGAFDPDMDSLSYSLVPYKIGPDTVTGYNSPYTYDVPMPYTPPLNGNFPYGFKLDSRTGDLMFRPSSTLGSDFYGLVAIKIDQWRKIGSAYLNIGTTTRSVYVILTTCSGNTLPTFQTSPSGGSSTQPKTQWETVAGSQICFDIIANDADISDTTYLSIDSNLVQLGATFTPNYNLANRVSQGPREDSYKLCWTPSAAQVKSVPYPFMIKAMDSKCPNPGIISKGFTIKVNELITLNKSITCNRAALSHSTTSATITNRLWTVSLTPGVFNPQNNYTSTASSIALNFPKAGKYPVRLYLTFVGGGTQTVYDSVVIAKGLQINNDTTLCKSATLITLKQQNPDPAFILFKWYKLPDVINAVDSNAVYPVYINQNTSYLLKAYDMNYACPYVDTVKIISARIRMNMTVNKAQQCLKPNFFNFKSDCADTNNNPLLYSWRLSSGEIYSSKDSVIKVFTVPGNYTMTLKIATSFGCLDSIVKAIEVSPHPVSSFIVSDTEQCANEVFQFTNTTQITSGTFNSQWNPGDGTTFHSKDFSYLFPLSGFYLVKLVTVSDKGCKDSTSKYIKVLFTPGKQPIVGDTAPKYHSTSDYSVFNNSGSTFLWTIQGDSSHIINNNAVTISWGTSNNGLIVLKETVSNGCFERDTLKIRVYPNAGLTTLNELDKLVLYPQPATDKLMLSGKLEGLQEGRLITIEGKLLRQFTATEMKSGILDITDIRSGVYFLEVKNELNETLLKKVSIVK